MTIAIKDALKGRAFPDAGAFLYDTMINNIDSQDKFMGSFWRIRASINVPEYVPWQACKRERCRLRKVQDLIYEYHESAGT